MSIGTRVLIGLAVVAVIGYGIAFWAALLLSSRISRMEERQQRERIFKLAREKEKGNGKS